MRKERKVLLRTINHIKFTSREIDIISLILSGRSVKVSSSILGITPKTTETHLRNIMMKIGCNSKDGIINFVEKSEKWNDIKKHYLSLANDKNLDQNKTSESTEFSSKTFKKSNSLGKTFQSKYLVFSFFLISLLISFYWISWQKDPTNHVRSRLFIPNKNVFLKRNNILAQIKNSLEKQEKTRIVVLIGNGGAGKTTLARDYAQSFSGDLIWEINCENIDTLRSSLSDLAHSISNTKKQQNALKHLLEIKSLKERDKNLAVFLQSSLKKKKNWLLIYDNVENISDILYYLPTDASLWGHGTSIITTQNSNIENSVYISPDHIIKVPELSNSEAKQLFMTIINRGSTASSYQEQITIQNLLDYLPHFPLDISLAAYYIRSSHTPLNVYLQRISHPTKLFEDEQTELLHQMGRYLHTRDQLVSLSFEKVFNKSEHFKKLLFLICLLDSQNITKKILGGFESYSLIESFIRQLNFFSLLNTENELKTSSTKYFIHRSTQNHGLHFLMRKISPQDQKLLIKDILEKFWGLLHPLLEQKDSSLSLFIPHLLSMENKISSLALDSEVKKEGSRLG